MAGVPKATEKTSGEPVTTSCLTSVSDICAATAKSGLWLSHDYRVNPTTAGGSPWVALPSSSHSGLPCGPPCRREPTSDCHTSLYLGKGWAGIVSDPSLTNLTSHSQGGFLALCSNLDLGVDARSLSLIPIAVSFRHKTSLGKSTDSEVRKTQVQK